MNSNTSPSYQELKAQADELMRQANILRGQEKEKAIVTIKEQIQALSITPEELGFRSVRKYKKQGSTGKYPPRYRDENGNEWSGMGRMPTWLHEFIKSGGDRESLLIEKQKSE